MIRIKPLNWMKRDVWSAKCPILGKEFSITHEEGKFWAIWDATLPGSKDIDSLKAAAENWRAGWILPHLEVAEAAPPALLNEELALLLDAGAVHRNMLSGRIAKPSIAQIRHLYGEELDQAVLDAHHVSKEKPGVAAWPSPDQAASACMSCRHDFGLLSKEKQDSLIWEAREWLHAWRKEAPQAETELEARTVALKIALADAIRRPMGVIPASAEGLVSTADLDAAEARRTKGGGHDAFRK